MRLSILCLYSGLYVCLYIRMSTLYYRMLKWQSMLRYSFPTEIDGHLIASTQDIVNAVQSARLTRTDTVICKFFIIEKVAMHPQLGVPILYND